jgi:hypothetical protein
MPRSGRGEGRPSGRGWKGSCMDLLSRNTEREGRRRSRSRMEGGGGGLGPDLHGWELDLRGLPLRPSSLASPCSLAPGGWSCVKGREGGEVRGGGFLKDGLRRGARRRRAREGGVSRVPGPVSPSSSSSRPRVAPASAPIIAARRGRRYPYRWRKRWTQEEHLDPPAWGHGHR